jgi:hypothetical protein
MPPRVLPAVLALALLPTLLAGAPAGAAPDAPAKDPDLERLAAWMTGTFASAEQAKSDPEEYRDVRLGTARIWTERPDGPWLYVEQAVAGALDRPYRQRVYRLRHVGDDLFESRVHELPDPLRFAGAFADPSRLAALSPDDLSEMTGCAVVLRRIDETTFRGSTLGSACTNDFRGASFATSEVTVTAEGIDSWDRGYDAAWGQVWGATKGPYRFRRATP